MRISNSFPRLAGLGALLAGGALLGACSSSSKDKTDAGANNGGSANGGDSGAPTAGADWTMMGFDNKNTYFNQAEKKITKDSVKNWEKAWEFDAGDGNTVTCTPVVANGKAYLLSSAKLTAVDLATGNVEWESDDCVADPAAKKCYGGYSSLAYADHVLYVNDIGGVLHAVSDADGSELWKNQPDTQAGLVGFSSPIVTKDYVLVGGSTLEEVAVPAGGASFRGFIAAVKKDGTDGWKRYTIDEPEHGVTLWSSVSVDEADGTVYAATGNNHGPPAGAHSDAFLAVPLADGGDFKWTPLQILTGDIWEVSAAGGAIGSPDADFGANPILFEVDGRKLMAAGNKGGNVMVADRTTGEKIQTRNLGPGSANRGGVFINGAWDGKHLLFAANGATSTGDGSETPADPANVSTLFALDPLTLDVIWERQLGDVVFGTISVANGVGFVGKNATLQAFDTETGEKLAEFPTEATIATSPAVSNGYVVFGSGMSWSGGSIAGQKYYAVRVP
ncbi:MAG TPA: PQQ-binding-like beta-propeller repeat protein [Polyangiaceae bacterium]|nr:PQQ-binding-like beta-propeller repeat protein [Polyangiaceae bacterium]